MNILLIWQRFQTEEKFAPLFELYHIVMATPSEYRMLVNSNMAFINSSSEHPDSKKIADAIKTKWKDSHVYLSTDTPIYDNFDIVVISGTFE